MRRGTNYRSGRINPITLPLYMLRARYPKDRIIVMDESVYLLDVLEIGLQKMYEPMEYFRYDGRVAQRQRENNLRAFSTTDQRSVLLATRGCGGLGLNMQFANILGRTGPWWKTSWEEQAEGRIYRSGQIKPVRIIELQANGSLFEAHMIAARDRKARTNTLIMDNITIEDIGTEPVRELK